MSLEISIDAYIHPNKIKAFGTERNGANREFSYTKQANSIWLFVLWDTILLGLMLIWSTIEIFIIETP
jgi:hypothetical protein